MDSKGSIDNASFPRRFIISSHSPYGFNDSPISPEKLSYSTEGSNNSLILLSKANHRAFYSPRMPDMSRNNIDKASDRAKEPDNLRSCLGSSDRSSDSLLSIRKSSDSKGRIDRSSICPGGPVESRDILVILDKSSDSPDSPDGSTDSSDSSGRSSDSPVSIKESSKDFEDSSYESSENSDYPDEYSDSSRSHDETSDSSDIPEGKSDLPESPDDASDCPDSSDSLDEPGDSLDEPGDSLDEPGDSLDEPGDSLDEPSVSPESTFRSSNSAISRDRSFCSDINVWLNGNLRKPTRLSLISSRIFASNCSSNSPGGLNNSLVIPEGSNDNYDTLRGSLYVLAGSRLFIQPGILSSKSNNYNYFQPSREKYESFVGLSYDYCSYILFGNNLKKFLKAGKVEVCVKRMLEQSKIIDSKKSYITNNKIGSLSLTNGNLQLHDTDGHVKGEQKLIRSTPESTTRIVCYKGECEEVKNLQTVSDIYLNPTMEYMMLHGATHYLNKEDKQVERVILSETTSNGRVDDELEVIKDYAFGKIKWISENVLHYAENSQLKDKANELSAIPKTSVNDISGIELSVQSDSGDESFVSENNLKTEKQPKSYSESSYEKRMAGSRVEDIEEYQSTTGTNRISENLHSPNKNSQLGTSSNSLDLVSLDVIKSVKVICDSVLDTFQNCFNNIINIAKLKVSPDSSTVAITQSESDTDSEEDSFESIEDSTNDKEPFNCSDTNVSPSKRTIKITSLYTLFKHLTAAAGTDITAEQVTEDINSKVVLDLHNGFHELRTVDYSNLELMEKCIRGCISTLQNVMLKSHDIFTRNSVLMHMEARSFAEMKELNEDLNELAHKAEMHMNDIESAVTGLSDFTEDYIYYKDCLSNELSEFLMEDFPEIFK